MTAVAQQLKPLLNARLTERILTMLVRKAKGSWVRSKKDPSKRIYFLEAEGEAKLSFRAVYMYVDGKKLLLRVVGRFLKDDGTTVRLEAEGIVKAKKAMR